jgi:CRISPR-associated endonuclease/helicase Cas3
MSDAAPSFEAFFSRATGHPPFPFQSRLAEVEAWPDLLTVPTGAGKTATVVLGWAWRRLVRPHDTPRRLVYCLPVRSLVDQTAREAVAWMAKLGLDVPVHLMLGGAVDQSWEDQPDRPAILIGTQDQLLSRALNRGYAMSRFRWPVHFALLHNDAQWVFDETQLMGVGLSTSAQLQALREQLGTALPARSLWMSATNAPGRLATVDLRARPLASLGLSDADRESPALRPRLVATKAVVRLDDALREPARLARWVAEQHTPGSLTLVVLNRVARAVEVAAALEKHTKGVPLRLLHSRFRRVDRAAMEDALLPGFSGVVVATQAIEAGVDVSARLLVTDLAPWPSLIQRAGRCNRRGEHSAGVARVAWVDVPEKDAAPYMADALAAARARIEGLTDLGPATLATLPEDVETPAMPVLRRKDLLELFDTEPDLAGRHLDVSRWVRDQDDIDVQIAWRALPADGPEPGAPRAHRDELCRVGIGPAKKLLKGQTAYRWDGLAGAWARVVGDRVIPGDVLLVDTKVGGYDPKRGFTGQSRDVPPPVGVPDVAEEGDSDDRWSVLGQFVTLAAHSDDIVAEVEAILGALPDVGAGDDLAAAARWHDLGKVHPAFQRMLTSGLPGEDPRRAGGPWAKSDGTSTKRCERKHFRHELASALVWLANGGSDRVAYLIAAHHGKVRLAVRPRPGEAGRGVVLGVREGDELPGVALGGGVEVAACALSPDAWIAGAEGASWVDRMARLLDEHGPFRLALWEALVRVADWRASRRYTGGADVPA